MPPHITDEFYEQGLSLYHSGGTLRHLHETMAGIEAQERAAEDAFVPSSNPQPISDAEHHRGTDRDAENHRETVRKRFRSAEPSLTMGFADGMLADIRRIASGRGGQRA